MPSLALINKRIVCPVCSMVMILPELTEDDLPFDFQCPHCKQEYHWTALPSMPKIDPSKGKALTAKEVIVKLRELVIPADEQLPGDTSLAAFKDYQEVVSKPFREHASLIDDGMKETLNRIGELHSDLDILAANVREQFTMESDYAKKTAFNWDAEKLKQFVRNPITAIDAPATDYRIAPYCKFIFSPSFYHPHVGFPLHSHGSFYLELACPYSRLAYPISNLACDAIAVPNNLHLYTAGDKVLGRSLKYCFDDIEGATHDHDHNDTHPSVKIHNRMDVFRWLVDHGVNPWPKNSLAQLDKRHIKEDEGIFLALKQYGPYYHAFAQFHEYGRMLICWSDIGEAREFCILMAYLFRHPKAVIVYDSLTRQSWRDVTICRNVQISHNEFIYALYEDVNAIDMDKLNQIPLLIVDYQDGISLDFMKKLIHYKGRLLVIGPTESALTLLDDNTEMSILSALTGTIVVDNLDAHGESWRDTKLRRSNPLYASVKRITKKIGWKPKQLPKT